MQMWSVTDLQTGEPRKLPGGVYWEGWWANLRMVTEIEVFPPTLLVGENIRPQEGA